MQMCQIQGHYWGKTWVGATPPCRAAAQADAVLVAPTRVLPRDQCQYRAGTDGAQRLAAIAAQRRTTVSKLRVEKGASKVRRAPLKATIDGAVADDLELMCEWSENESSYLVNLLLGFAIAQSEDFQRYKTERLATPFGTRTEEKPASDPARKIVPSANPASPQLEKRATA
jgi:hypothetical protein